MQITGILCSFLLAGLLLAGGGTSFAQDSVVYPYSRLSMPFIRSGFSDAGRIVLVPGNWRGKEWAGFGVIAAGGIGLYLADEKIRDFSQRHQGTIPGKAAKYLFEPWGSGMYSAPLVGGLYLAGRVSGDDRLSATALSAGKAAVISSVFVQLTKQLTHRHRPYQDNPANASHWDGPFSEWRYSSFPSGHSTLAFSIATVFASEYRQSRWIPALSYLLATGTALSRIYDDKHWASDVLIGSAFGYACGRFIWKNNRQVVLIPGMHGEVTLLMPLSSWKLKKQRPGKPDL